MRVFQDMSRKSSRYKPEDCARPRWRHTSGYVMSEKEKEGLSFGKRAPSADDLAAQDDTREQEERKEKEGERVAQVLRLTRIVVVRSLTGSRRAAQLASVIVAVFETCMLTMRTEGGVRSREPAISVV